MNWDYVRGKKTKRKIKINKQKGNKQKKINKKIKKKFIRQFASVFNKKMIRNIFVIQLSDRVYNVTFPAAPQGI